MENKTTKELVKDLEQELMRLGYTDGSMKFYRRRWNQLLEFAKERNELYYSEQLGIDFLEKYFNILNKDSNENLTQRDVQDIRVIRRVGQ